MTRKRKWLSSGALCSWVSAEADVNNRIKRFIGF